MCTQQTVNAVCTQHTGNAVCAHNTHVMLYVHTIETHSRRMMDPLFFCNAPRKVEAWLAKLVW